jgi:hypothetical protein
VITNKADISLALAVWLLHDDYDHINEPNYISATSLMKPLRHILLPPRMEKDDAQPMDVEDFIPRALGNSLHNSIEKAWTQSYAQSLRKMGYPDSVIHRIRINPEDVVLDVVPDIIPIYLEQRAFREIDGFTIGGKFDLVTEGVVQDTKSTSAYTWLHDRGDDSYQLQGSLYRWIDAAQPRPKITEDYMRVNFIFTDWQKAQARANPKYPQHRIEHKEIPLLSLAETEAWVRAKLALIQKYKDTPEERLPECTDVELWRSEPVYKYYADATKTTGRSTKNFATLAEAYAFQSDRGGGGVLLTVPGEPKRCGYCPAFNICKQKDRYFST